MRWIRSRSCGLIETGNASTGGAFTLQRSYVYGSYIDDILAKVAPGSGELYYHRDRQYSVRGLTDSTGVIVELYAYSPYGQQVGAETVSGTVSRDEDSK
jgi:hypothetical protein